MEVYSNPSDKNSPWLWWTWI